MPLEENRIRLKVEKDISQRIDIFIRQSLEEYSRQKIKKWIQEGNVFLNGREIKPKQNVKQGDVIEISPSKTSPSNLALEAENLPLEILYEDESLLVINKASGMLTHPCPGNYKGTLANALLYHCSSSLSQAGGVERPGIVHRLDKETSGCIVIAKDDFTHHRLALQFAERSIGKFYLAISKNLPKKKQGKIVTHICRHPIHRLKMMCVSPPLGKKSITRYRILNTDEKREISLFLCKPSTGRTHQIRLHLFHEGNPILGDPLYAPKLEKMKVNRLMLHSFKLIFTHPKTLERMQFKSPLPESFRMLYESFKRK